MLLFIFIIHRAYEVHLPFCQYTGKLIYALDDYALIFFVQVSEGLYAPLRGQLPGDLKQQTPVVLKLDNAINQINRYAVEKC